MSATAKMIEIDYRMSNFDNNIDEGFAEALQANPGKVFGRHAAWDFNGKVWFDEGKFHDEVMVKRLLRKTMSAGSLRELMDVVCDEFGYD